MVVSPHPEDVAQQWRPEPLLAGATVFILGGGPSLRCFDFGLLRGLRTIAVNEAARYVVEHDFLYFGDANWYEDNRAFVEAWRGVGVTGSRVAKQQCPRLRRVLTTSDEGFPTHALRRGRSSGHVAVSLAIAMQASLIVLLGFDMRGEGNRSHFHDRYRNNDLGMYGREFVPSFNGWDRAARKLGVTVLNATPGSALDEFRKVRLADVLERSSPC